MTEIEIVNLYISIFILEIILLIISIRKKENKYWIFLFFLEIVSIVTSYCLMIYYEYKPITGYLLFENMGETLLSMMFYIIYLLLSFISIVIKIFIYEKKQKIKNLKHYNPLILIVSLIFIFVGISELSYEFYTNYGQIKTTGTVIGFTNNDVFEKKPIIQVFINGKKYEEDFYFNTIPKKGDKVKVYYSRHPNGSYEITNYHLDNKKEYILCFIIGLLIILFRFKDKILLQEK